MSSRVRASAVAVTARRGTLREDLGQPAQHAVLGAEVVAPLADAVGLVDGHQRQRQARQPLQHGRLHQAFGREVEQVQRARRRSRRQMSPRASGSVLESSRSAATPDCCRAATWSAISAISGETTRPRPRPHQRRDLVAQALAAAGRQHRQRAAPGQHLADHAGLQAAELGVAERAAQDVARGVECVLRGGSRVWGIGGHANLMRRRGQSCNRRLARVLPSEEKSQRGRLRTAPRSGPSR